jgi:hypothetical protein
MFAAITAGQDMAAPSVHKKVDCPTPLQAWMETRFKKEVAHIRCEHFQR